MALSPDEQEIWSQQISGLEDPTVDFEPIRLRVDDLALSPGDLLHAIEVNMGTRRLVGKKLEYAMGFVELLLNYSPDVKAAIAELPYEVGADGLELILRFPHHGSGNGEA